MENKYFVKCLLQSLVCSYRLVVLPSMCSLSLASLPPFLARPGPPLRSHFSCRSHAF